MFDSLYILIFGVRKVDGMIIIKPNNNKHSLNLCLHFIANFILGLVFNPVRPKLQHITLYILYISTVTLTDKSTSCIGTGCYLGSPNSDTDNFLQFCKVSDNKIIIVYVENSNRNFPVCEDESTKPV
jgi:hypothetical protein